MQAATGIKIRDTNSVYVRIIALHVSTKAMNTPFHTAIFYTYECLRIKLCFFLKYVLCMFLLLSLRSQFR